MNNMEITLKTLVILLALVILQIYSAQSNFCDYCDNRCNFGPNFHHWIIEERQLSPDNYVQTGKVINGEFPGPTIHIHQNSYLVVKVENRLPEGLSIHWHGIHQDHTLASDGADMITQHEISPNGTFTYCILIGNQVGTYMYHAHSRLDIIWLHGALIIDDFPMMWANGLNNYPDYLYYDERIIILEQLYHIPVSQLLNQILITGGHPPGSASLLINGQSYGEWIESNNNTTSGNCEGYHVTQVQRGVTYRFRVINLSSDQLLRFSITNHNMRIIEADGIYIEPVDVEYLDIHTAQRYSVVVTMDQAVNNYWMESKSIGEQGPGNGAAILHYIGAPDPTKLKTQIRNTTIDAIPMDDWISSTFYPTRGLKQESVYPVPAKVDKNIYIDFHAKVIPPIIKFEINGHIFQDPEEPYLAQVRNNVNITDEPQVFEVLEGQGVQVILQNRAGGPSSQCEAHPWHFHGRFFYIVAHGPDEFIQERDIPLIDETVSKANGQLPFRDIFIQYPHQKVANHSSGATCGWYAIRFRANNAGIWLAHCHITPHMIMGKMFVIWEHSVDNPTLIGE